MGRLSVVVEVLLRITTATVHYQSVGDHLWHLLVAVLLLLLLLLLLLVIGSSPASSCICHSIGIAIVDVLLMAGFGTSWSHFVSLATSS